MLKLSEIPRELEIGENVWKVRFVRHVGESKVSFDTGLCDPSDHTIYIRQKLTAAERFKTLVHEIFHAFEHEYGLKIPHKLVHALEEPILQFFMWNWIFRPSEDPSSTSPSELSTPAACPLRSRA